MKQCKRCKQDKSLTDFKKEVENKDGFSGTCKQCHYEAKKKKLTESKNNPLKAF